MRQIPLFAFAVISLSLGTLADEIAENTSHDDWAKGYESHYAQQMTSVSPLQDGWMLAARMDSGAGEVLAFDRDDELAVGVTLIDLRRNDRPVTLAGSGPTATVRIPPFRISWPQSSTMPHDSNSQ